MRFENNHDEVGALAVAEALKYHPELETLDLRGNRIQDMGIVSLVEAMESGDTPRLRNLILGTNRFGLEGCQALARVLDVCQLECLDLNCVEGINDDCLSLFARALYSNFHVKELNLFGCTSVTEAGARCLLECLQNNNHTLQYVNLKPKISAIATQGMLIQEANISASYDQVMRQIEYWLSLNRAGRCLLHDDNAEQIPPGLWAHILAKKPRPNTLYPSSGHDEIYFHLRETPDICCHSRG